MPDQGETRNGDTSRHSKVVAAATFLCNEGAFIGWGSSQDGKAVKNRWKSDMTADPNMVPALLSGGRNSVIVPQGRMVIIDVDKHGWYERLKAQGLPPTFTLASPTIRRADNSKQAGPDWDGETFRGRHVYVNAPAGYDVTAIPGVWNGGETRRSQHGEQSMVLGPWSLRSDGVYEPLDDAPRTLAEVPASLLDWLIAQSPKTSAPLITIKATDDGDWTWDESMGSRHDHLRDKIRKWRGNGLDETALVAAAESYISRHAIPLDRGGGESIDSAEIMRMIKGALDKYGDDVPDESTAPFVGGGETQSGDQATGGRMEVELPPVVVGTMPAAMAKAAFTGSPQLASLMDHFTPRTDANYEGLLITSLTYLSALFGPKPTLFYGSKVHHTPIYSVLVGPTGIGRKGTTTSLVRDALSQVTEMAWKMKRSPNSGEGLIALAVKAAGEPILVEEEEFDRLIKSKGRDNSTLSHILRQAFDGGVLTSATAAKIAHAEKHHIAMLGNVTREEIVTSVEGVDLKNGFANRILWAATLQRNKDIPPVQDNALSTSLRDELRDVLKDVNLIPAPLIGGATHRLTDDARAALMDAGSSRYGAGVGMAPFVSRRLDTIAARIALMYALLDYSRVVTIDHVTSALAVTDYAYASAKWVFPDTTGDADADLLLRYMREAEGRFLSTREIEAIIGKRPKDKVRASDSLQLMGYAIPATRPRIDGKPGKPRSGLALVEGV